ncbi:subtilisin family serine protease [Sphingomonas endophytica]|uniref:Subtilisin family serine protease n=1 Tax=Sphingomonas endophytica TaxID=869719 RepID=A0A7X0MNL8_9SPHN|nr:S8 family serine peptidase [Sphingomonas endophytica]MBB6505291.1 subtilisin family serine protease [Sphingomonas endophytica]
MPRVTLRTATALAAALGLAACGGAGVAAPGTNSPPPYPAATPAPSPAPTPAAGVSAAQRAEDDASAAAVLARADDAYARGITGKGVTIAVLDTGVARTSPEFAGRLSPDSTGFAQTVARCASCAPETIAPYPVDDRVGHGSGVAAIALAARDGSAMHGVAPEATLLALKIVAPDLAASGASLPEGSAPNPQLIAPALRYAVDRGAFVSVLALDGGASTTLATDLRTAMDRVRAADRLVVQAVPNHDDGTDNEIAQALVGKDRGNARWFLYAVALDASGQPRDGNGDPGALADRTLAVAGNGVRTIDAHGATVTVSGNSFAAPAVAGAAALLKQYWPQLGAATIARILLDTADDRGAPGVDAVYGAGVLDVARALRAQAPASAFAAARGVLARYSALALSTPFGGAPQLSGRVAALTVVDRYGRDFVLRGAGVRRSGGALRVGGLAAPWLPDAPATGPWAGVMPRRPAALSMGQHVTIAAQVALDGGDGLSGTQWGGATLPGAGITGVRSAWRGAGWSVALARGRARDGRADLRRVTLATPVGLGTEVTLLAERGQVLGAALGAAGARTWLAALTGARRIAAIDWTARLTLSRTDVRGGSALLRLDRRLSGSAAALAGSKPLFGGVATLGVASPLRLDHTTARATVPLSFDLVAGTLGTAVQRVDLTPRAREWDVELGWSARLGARGTVRLGVAHAVAAGHVAGAHDTAGFVSVAVH